MSVVEDIKRIHPSGHHSFLEELPSIYELFELDLLNPQVVSVSGQYPAQVGKSAFAVRNSKTSLEFLLSLNLHSQIMVAKG